MIMKTIKYLFVGALLTGFSTAAIAQDGTAADIDAVTRIINSKPADVAKQVNPYYKKNKKNAEHLVAFGRAFYNAKDYANATTYANYALSANKKYAPAFLLLGDIAAIGDADGGTAAQNYEQAIYFDPTNPDPYRRYASVYRKVSLAGAIAKLEELRQHVPDYPVDALIGHINYISLKYGSALQAFANVRPDQMTKMDYIEYAFSAYITKAYDKALEIVQTGLRVDPNNATLNRLGLYAATELGKNDVAKQYADMLFNRIDRDSVNISDKDHLFFGRALSADSLFDAAIEQFQKGLQLNADTINSHSDIHLQMSNAHKGKKDYPQAIAKYKDYLESVPEVDATSFAGLGSLYMLYARTLEGDEQLNAFREADNVFTQLIEKYPGTEEYGYYQRARANSNMDPDMSQGLAKPHFEKVVELISARDNLDQTDKNRLEGAYRYLMSYNYTIAKDNEATLMYANKILELKPEEEGILRLVESLSKTNK